MRRSTWALALLAMALLQSAVLAQKAPREQAYCFFDQKTLTWRLGSSAFERTIHFDKAAGSLRTTRLVMKLKGVAIAPVTGSDAEIAVTPDGAKPVALRLDRDWDYIFQIVKMQENGARLLTIHLQGKKQNAGFELEANYAVDPGKRARLSDSVLLINRTGAPVRLSGVQFGRWILVEPGPKVAPDPRAALLPGDRKDTATLAVGAAGPRLIASIERTDTGDGAPAATGEVTLQQNALVLTARPEVTIEPGGRWQSPRASVQAQPAAPRGTAAVR